MYLERQPFKISYLDVTFDLTRCNLVLRIFDLSFLYVKMCNLMTIITNPFRSLYVRSLVITLVISRVGIDESISDVKGKREWSDRVTSSFPPPSPTRLQSVCYTHVIPFVHGNSSTERILLREITNFQIVYRAKGNRSREDRTFRCQGDTPMYIIYIGLRRLKEST